MAKVINPLLSGSASGQIGHMMTFQKNGIVRQYVTPANPQSVGQMAVRNTLKDVQASLKKLGAVLRAEFRTAFGARWNALIIGELTANGNAALDAYVAEFTAFTSQQKLDWADEDTGSYVVLDDGAVLYACASVAFDMAARLGETVSLTEPAAGNSSTVGAEWIAAA
jgi:hypothetical protein